MIMEKIDFNVKSLEETLAYQNDVIVYNFIEKFDMPFAEANNLFIEVKRWLWLCAMNGGKTKNKLYINQDLRILDQMWHVFILFTYDYKMFCLDYLGTFINHSPTPYQEKAIFQKMIDDKNELFFEKNRKKEKEFYEIVYDTFGNEILRKWFLEFPLKYSTENIKNMYKGIYE